ncbi:Leucine-rich repeat and IQ domain-containing protein 3, putative isoform 2 [Hibiscus syriacus]|uniref:Leucine-rich repeat and IQ domain-containing protein 3, putative isoform 2 n=1 Tax=Hibiscus syriacus TaxID=106335 RepID=A0A6A2ZSD1_HIBSY|nr:Leucine-rich repeat and IQ domain-containing protein 3, putative isoform 2 [Hibiscus syriacus]
MTDKLNPFKGVIVRMSSSGKKHNCSLSVSLLCDSAGAQGPNSMEKLGTCEYATMLRHPSACATIISIHGKGFVSYASLEPICFLAIPNLDFWISLPHRTQMYVSSLVLQFRGPSASQGGSYSQVNF